MQATLYDDRANSILKRVEVLLNGGEIRLDTIAEFARIQPITLKYLLARKDINAQTIAWDNFNEALDKLGSWLDFSTFSDSDEAVIQRLEKAVAMGDTLQALHRNTGVEIENLERLRRRMKWDCDETNRQSPVDAITALKSHFGREDDVCVTPAQSLAFTETYELIQGLLESAQQKRRFIAITGDVGIGKTMAAKAYANNFPKTHRRPGALYLKFSGDHASRVAAMRHILAALPGNGQSHPKHADAMFNEIKARLRPGDLLVFDECNYLAGKKGSGGEAVDLIRDLYDEGTAAIVMFGNTEFQGRVWGKDDAFAPLVSRITHYTLGQTSEDDVIAWFKWKWPHLPADGPLLKACMRLATRSGAKGGLRTLAVVVEEFESNYPAAELCADGLLEAATGISRGINQGDRYEQ